MIRFLPQANFTWAQCEDYQEQKFLHKALTVICPHRYKVKAYRDGHWNGMWYFLEDDDHFLTGLLPKVLRIADRQEFKYLVVNEEDVRVVGQDLINLKAGYLNVLWPLHKWFGGPDMSGFEERDYQQQAIYKAVMAQRGVISSQGPRLTQGVRTAGYLNALTEAICYGISVGIVGPFSVSSRWRAR